MSSSILSPLSYLRKSSALQRLQTVACTLHREIRARIGNNGAKKYEMTVSTYQMCILVLFNERSKVNYHELLQSLNVHVSALSQASLEETRWRPTGCRVAWRGSSIVPKTTSL